MPKLPAQEVPEECYRKLYDFLVHEFPENVCPERSISETVMSIMRHYRAAYHNLRQVVPGENLLPRDWEKKA